MQTRGQLRADLHKCLSTKRATRRPRGHRGRTGVYAPGEDLHHQRPPGRGRRSGRTRALGRRSDHGRGSHAARSAPWWNARPGSPSCCTCPSITPPKSVAAAMIEAMGELPEHLRRSITWDRGSEMAEWRSIQLQLQAPVFFCNPHSPVAARHQRKHQPAAAVLVRKRQRPQRLHQSRPQTRRRQTQHPPHDPHSTSTHPPNASPP